MARFVVGTPQVTREPTITVDAGLPVGRHRFRLEVVDASGQRSAPDDAIIEVQRIIVDPGPIIPSGPIIATPGPVIGPVTGPITGPVTGPITGTIRPPTGPIIRTTRPRRKKEKP